MSFYGSIYYQLVDAFNRLWFSNQGREVLIFPEAEDLTNPTPAEGVPEDTFEYHSPGRQGVIDLKTGNRWLGFTQNKNDNSFKLWHREPDEENVIPGHGFQHIPNVFMTTIQGGETAQQTIDRALEETRAKFEAEKKEFVLETGCRVIVEIPNEIEGLDSTYTVYIYNVDEEWEEEGDPVEGLVTVLSPDDFFVTTESFTVDKAGHMVPSERRLYKMPKSDVQEEIDELKARMTLNENHDIEQDDDIKLLEEYVGEWDKYRGATSDAAYNYWMPSISSTIGDVGFLIAGEDGETTFNDDGSIKNISTYYKSNQDVNLVRAIGSLTQLQDSLKAYDTYFVFDKDSKLSDISLIDVILYIKDQLVAANTASIKGHTELLDNLTRDVNTLYRQDDDQVGRLEDLEDRATDLEEEDVKIYTKIAEEKALLDLEDRRLDGRIDEVSKAVGDHALASTEAHNQLGERITLLSTELKAEIDSDVAAESAIINGRITSEVNTINGKFDAIHHAETGILKQAQNYTDALATGAVAGNTAAIEAINNTDSGILKQAQNYTDAEIAKMTYTDAPTDGQYVYSVNEANGVISVEHKALPTYTLTSGETIGTVAFNGTDVAVKGLGSAAYADTSAFDPANSAATAKTEAIAAAKTETENQIAALSEEGGAIQVNAKAIEDLELLLANYSELVAKVAELEQRIAALEPPVEPEPDPDPMPDEPGEDPEPTPPDEPVEEPEDEPTEDPDPEPEQGEDPETT